MTFRALVQRTLEFHEVERVPLEVTEQWVGLPGDVEHLRYRYGQGKERGTVGRKGSRVDSWGCIWEAGEDGVKGEVKRPLLADWADIRSFRPPFEILEQADLSGVNAQCADSERFMVHMWGTEPFQRMQYLRGTENVFLDLAYGDSRLVRLRDMVHDFFVKEVTLWEKTDVDAIHIEDDWGTQRSMLVSPNQWREYFKPLYRDYCDIARTHGKPVIMHSDGHIAEIIPDLVEIGVNALNAHIDCMDPEDLADRFQHRIVFWGGFDRQYLLPFGTRSEVESEVRKIASAFFKYGRTGVVGQCFADKDALPENVRAVYETWTAL